MIYRGAITVDRKVKTFAQLVHANGLILERAKKKEPGYYWDVMSSLVFSAFAFEASLNHIGPKTISYWEELERLPRKNKLTILLKHLNLTPNFGKRPFQSLHALYLFRDAIAHGRDEEISFGPEERVIDSATFKPREIAPTPQEELCTLDHAQAAFDDMKAIITQLFKAAGLGDKPFFSSDSASYSISFI